MPKLLTTLVSLVAVYLWVLPPSGRMTKLEKSLSLSLSMSVCLSVWVLWGRECKQLYVSILFPAYVN